MPRSRDAATMIFLCEHETQGIAYQQALSCGVPILAWDRGGFWQDPEFYPHRVKFAPVSSVPYWDDRCGIKFASIEEFDDACAAVLGRSFNRAVRSAGLYPREPHAGEMRAKLFVPGAKRIRRLSAMSGGAPWRPGQAWVENNVWARRS